MVAFKAQAANLEQARPAYLEADMAMPGAALHPSSRSDVDGYLQHINKMALSGQTNLPNVGLTAETMSAPVGMTPYADAVWGGPGANGWHRSGGFSWVKSTPLPPNWGSMSDKQREQWLTAQGEQDRDDFSWITPGGGAKVGWHPDGEGGWIWFGYAGDEPKGPPPSQRSS